MSHPVDTATAGPRPTLVGPCDTCKQHRPLWLYQDDPPRTLCVRCWGAAVELEEQTAAMDEDGLL